MTHATTKTSLLCSLLMLLTAASACGGDAAAGPAGAGARAGADALPLVERATVAHPARTTTLDAIGADRDPAACPVAGQVPFPEVCNAFDDDCDGAMDEGACSDPCDAPW